MGMFLCFEYFQCSQYKPRSFNLHLLLNLSLQIQQAALVEFVFLNSSLQISLKHLLVALVELWILNLSLQISLKQPLVGFGVNQQGDQSPSRKMQPAHLLQGFCSAMCS